jgi:hypothetical protein
VHLTKSALQLSFLMALFGCGWHDTGCKQDKYYCLPDEEQKKYVQQASDAHLLKLAIIDHQVARPPSSHFVYELAGRGERSSRTILYDYGGGNPDRALLDDMVRIFSRDWSVCTVWLSGAPSDARRNIRQSCNAVFRSS